MKVLLMGNPNVGKSVVFSRLTGTNVTSSNYPGTTVEYTKGKMNWKGQVIEIIDVPGTYTLEPTNKAEEVAVDMLKEGDLIINVVDATNLERNLNLTLQLLEKRVPVIVALNLWDEAKHKGIEIDVDKLSWHLGVPVIPTVAIKGNGIKDLIDNFDYRDIVIRNLKDGEERWAEIGRIIKDVQRIEHRHHSWLETLDDMSIRPVTGIPILLLVLYASFKIIRLIGEGLIGYVTEPFFDNLYGPLIARLSTILGSEGFLHDLLVGQLINGEIDFGQSFGLLTTGIFIPFASVLPYIIAFYFVLGLLEDTGYLPRLSVLVDNIMHRVGLHGFSVIPMILGFGCNVPAALAARNLESRREKFIASTLMAIAIPCMAQIAMILGLLGPHGARYIGYVFSILGAVWIIIGLMLNRLLPGFSSDLLLEIPPFRPPVIGIVAKKLWIRISNFLQEAVPLMLLGVFSVNLLYVFGVFDTLAVTIGPFLNRLFGLPDKAISALLMGFLRKDLAMGMLAPLGLTAKQLVTASTVLTIYFPCIATFAVLLRELGIIDMLKSTMIMLITTLIVGGFVNLTFSESGFTFTGWLIIVLVFIAIKYIPARVNGKELNSFTHN
ncbi:Fe(2+) transporter FeoB [Koleobacter methoxysyntrophicus]|uniref:Fe(2+) transporter FeoB n=1 Tax=Koleobacter methoxysyntrophicus TaxID=2751313 RepID=A0A8A0RP85_9FIRM|nr:ferrous iron transporter B [Koleobacter methoxysyntrophicus]QSQ09309.1 Fe(2+) transporter FeoB [Koleobacter methoxysyntrophicus]